MSCNPILELNTSPSYVRLVIPRGDDYGWFNCTITTKDGTDPAEPLVITGATFEGGIKKYHKDEDYLIEVEAAVVSGVAGTYRFRFTQADIDSLEYGESTASTDSQYVWNFVMTLTGGEVLRLYRGPVFIVA